MVELPAGAGAGDDIGANSGGVVLCCGAVAAGGVAVGWDCALLPPNLAQPKYPATAKTRTAAAAIKIFLLPPDPLVSSSKAAKDGPSDTVGVVE